MDEGLRRLRPPTDKCHDHTEVVPPGPRAAGEAEKVRARLLNQVEEQRNPRTKATVNQLLDRYLAVVDLEESTRKTYVGYLDVHVRPMLGALPLSKLNGEVLDTFYASSGAAVRTATGGVGEWTTGRNRARAPADPESFTHRYAGDMDGIHVEDSFPGALSPEQRGVSYRDVSATKRLSARREVMGFAPVVAAVPADYDGDFIIEVDERIPGSKMESYRIPFESALRVLAGVGS